MVPPKQETNTNGNQKSGDIVVFGGAGYVGGNVCKEAVAQGFKVISVNRSGPPAITEDWVGQVEWIKGDVFETTGWVQELEGAVGAVSSIGAFGNDEFMERICGDANVAAAEAAEAATIAAAASNLASPTLSLFR